MTKLSSDDKYDPDGSLQRLLDLNGEIMDMGDGHWVKFNVHRIEPDEKRPHGIAYSLCLFSPDDERLVCFNNAHSVATGSCPSKKQTEISDHVHVGEQIKPYAYSDAEELMSDFWQAVETVLSAKGVQS
ncbi:MAG TPA: DUF6516 family protein [Rhizomicrobium sp.]